MVAAQIAGSVLGAANLAQVLAKLIDAGKVTNRDPRGDLCCLALPVRSNADDPDAVGEVIATERPVEKSAQIADILDDFPRNLVDTFASCLHSPPRSL